MTASAIRVSVVLSTYNRATLLPAALDALLAQSATPPIAYEILVVDNNSTDETPTVVRRYVERHPDRVRYLFEPRQGLSYGRNTGIAAARGPIIAFTDDDVEVSRDWIARLVEAFESYPDAAYIGGRVLPHWPIPPPRWLTTAHWSPLALQDYGDIPLCSGPSNPICLVGANLAFRRDVFDRVGLFTGQFGRIRDGIGSTEDHDMQLRIWRGGLSGMYVPDILMRAEIQQNRFTREYHRRWHRGHGRHCARMRLREFVPEDLAPMRQPNDLVCLFGAPAFVYGEAARTASRWVRAVWRREDPFFYANRMRFLTSYLAESWARHRSESGTSPFAELWRFAHAYARKRAGARAAEAAG
jgi:glycosyltransferase involved in cell wall biosynthesis